jgi:WD40 repeat protein
MSGHDLHFFPVAFGEYEHFDPLNVDDEVAAVGAALAEFGGVQVPWRVPMRDRDTTAVAHRLEAWSQPKFEADTFLYWLGHGWSNSEHVGLAEARSVKNSHAMWIQPTQLAQAIADRQAHRDAGQSFAIVVIDACRSAQFVRLLNHEIDKFPGGPRRILLVGVSANAATTLGDFSVALRTVLRTTFRANNTIPLLYLVEGLERALPGGAEIRPLQVADAALRRSVPMPAGLVAPLDVREEIEEVLARLSEDERRHFVPKAQGGEFGEIAWYFEGRERERRAIVHWLRTNRSGMLIVTGAPGSGKSALLGHVVEQSRPGLRKALLDAGLTNPVPPEERPSDDVFDDVLHLTGVTPQRLLTRIALAAGLTDHPGTDSVTEQMDWLLSKLTGTGCLLTLLVDALDEAQQPLVTARQILRPLAAHPGVRLIVGTRDSTTAGPDHTRPGDQDVFEALGSESAAMLLVERDQAAVALYVGKRLRVAVGRGQLTGNAETIHLAIDQAGLAIAAQGREFLFARLAVHEILARGEIPADVTADEMFTGDHRTLFTGAVDRLTRRNPAYLSLLTALALSYGRGLPVRDDLWLSAARALSAVEVNANDIVELTRDAAPYLVADNEHEQTVYRLAHATFAEHFRTGTSDSRLPSALIELAERTAAEFLNPHLSIYLSGYVGAAGPQCWEELARHPWTIDRLDPKSLTFDALTTLMGKSPVPPEIAGVIGALQTLTGLPPSERTGVRQIAMARYAGVVFPSPLGDSHASWQVRWARFTSHQVNLSVTGQGLRGYPLTPVPDPSGRILLATGGPHMSMLLADPISGELCGDLATAEIRQEIAALRKTGSLTVKCDYPVARAAVAYRGPDGRTLLAVGGNDAILRIWDPDSKHLIHELAGKPSTINTIATFTEPSGRMLLAVSKNGKRAAIEFWNPGSGTQDGELSGFPGRVTAMESFTTSDGRPLLVISAVGRKPPGRLEIWDPVTRTLVRGLTGLTGRVNCVAVFEGPDGGRRIAGGCSDGTVRIWDISDSAPVAELPSQNSSVYAVTAFKSTDGMTLLATGGKFQHVRTWDALTGKLVSEFRDTPDSVRALVSFTGPSDQVLLAAGGGFRGMIHVWDPAGTPQPDQPPQQPGPAGRLNAFFAPDGRILLGSDLQLWDAADGSPVSDLRANLPGIHQVGMLTDQTGRILIAVTDNKQLTVVDGLTGTLLSTETVTTSPGDSWVCFHDLGGAAMIAHGRDSHQDPATVTVRHLPSLTIHKTVRVGLGMGRHFMPLADGRGNLLLACVGRERLRVFDLTSGRELSDQRIGFNAPRELVALPGSDGRQFLAYLTWLQTLTVLDVVGDPQGGLTVKTPSTSGIVALATVMNSDGRTILAVGADDTIRLIDPHDGSLVRLLKLGVQVTGLAAVLTDIAVATPDGGLMLGLA